MVEKVNSWEKEAISRLEKIEVENSRFIRYRGFVFQGLEMRKVAFMRDSGGVERDIDCGYFRGEERFKLFRLRVKK